MTQIQFSSALFCQRVSQAIIDALGDGMADGSDCVNRNLYVSSSEIGNIRTLNIVPPEGGFGNIDLETQPMSISGEWVTAFYNLTSLSMTDLYLQNISPLGQLTGRLTYLNLSNNRIGDISPLRALKESLTYLDLSGNQISTGYSDLGRFTKLTTLKLQNTGLSNLYELFQPPSCDMEYDETTWEPIACIDSETGERYAQEPTNSKLAEVLQVLDISNNEYMSHDKLEEDKSGECEGALYAFNDYSQYLVMTELYAAHDNLNSDDLICVGELSRLTKLDVSNNHIDDFSSVKSKSYTMLDASSQIFSRSAASLDYEPLPLLFTQAGEQDYFSGMAASSNIAVARGDLSLNNAQFNGDKVRFQNAAIASTENEEPHPATVTVPAGTGVFANSKLEVYFTGQVVTFNDSNLCNRIYQQGYSKSAFYDVEGNYTGSDEPVVLTNACNATKKQIAMVSGGSYQFLRLYLDEINDGASVDLTGLEAFSSLQVLSMNNNNLAAIDILANMYQLQHLWLNDNNLENDDWSTITNSLYGLGILYLNNNHMSVIPTEIGNLYRLGDLYLVNNGISDVSPLSYATTLTVLDLSENELITDFSGMVQDERACNPAILKLENAGVTRLPDASIIESGFTNLTSLNLNGNQITDETIANLSKAPRLDELYLNNNRITGTAGFSGIATLKKLFLDDNQITGVDGLLTLTRLAELHLKNNQISNIDNLNTLPALATLDLKNQTLTGQTEETDGTYELPAVFSQAITTVFPRVSGFQSAGNYTTENGTVDYDTMTATITDTAEPMTVTIPDGGLSGTTITVAYAGEDGEEEFSGTITNDTNNGAIIASTSANSFTVTSEEACMVLWSRDNGTTWNRLASSMVLGEPDMREFTLDQANSAQIVAAYAGDANDDHEVNVRDARKIVNTIMGKDSMTPLGEKLADVDGGNSMNVRDARIIINSIMGKAQINW
ncbi:leucine-rich repeat domain-containing protein [Candidatus Saccharibacteria bacterium]|nr:leucine-rich repeat domain-containing protein [Candidatus Saccharibacteria bacterium]